MKRIISILALVVLCLSITGCAAKSEVTKLPEQDAQTQPEQDTQAQPEQTVETETEKFVRENKDALVDELIANASPEGEEGITVTKDSVTVEAKGNAITIKIAILGLTEEHKQNMRDSIASDDLADEGKEYFNATFEAFKEDISTLESIELIYADETDSAIFSVSMNGTDVIFK